MITLRSAKLWSDILSLPTSHTASIYKNTLSLVKSEFSIQHSTTLSWVMSSGLQGMSCMLMPPCKDQFFYISNIFMIGFCLSEIGICRTLLVLILKVYCVWVRWLIPSSDICKPTRTCRHGNRSEDCIVEMFLHFVKLCRGLKMGPKLLSLLKLWTNHLCPNMLCSWTFSKILWFSL